MSTSLPIFERGQALYKDWECKRAIFVAKAEKKKCIYHNDVIDRKAVKANIFYNPFKRFEDMRFMKKCRDIEYVEFNSNMWKKLSGEEKIWIDEWC